MSDRKIGNKKHKIDCKCFICRAIRKETINKEHPRYNPERHKEYYCKNCRKRIGYDTWKTGSKLCSSCSRKNKNNPNFKDGHCCVPNFCIDCGKKIWYDSERCQSCATKYHLKVHKHPNFGKIFKNSGWRGKGSYYKNIWMRSSYEIKYAEYLDKNKIKWQYESKAFDLGRTTYRPDFYLPEQDLWIEVKGWFTKKSKQKINLFKKLYPKINLKILQKNELVKLGVKV